MSHFFANPMEREKEVSREKKRRLIFVVGQVVVSETDDRLLTGVRRTFLSPLNLSVGDEILFVHRRDVAEPRREERRLVERRIDFTGPIADRGEDENAVEMKFFSVETEENRPTSTVEEHRQRHVQQIGQT